MADGDQNAFCTIYRMFYKKLLRYGSIIVSDNDLVEDVIQDFFIWILEHPEKLKRIKNFEVYLFQSIKQNLSQKLKSERRKIGIIHQISKSTNSHSSSNNIEQKIIQEEQQNFNQQWVIVQLAKLPVRQKEVIFLRYYEGLSYEEIATITSTSSQVARNYASRAIKRIRQHFNKYNELLIFFLLGFIGF